MAQAWALGLWDEQLLALMLNAARCLLCASLIVPTSYCHAPRSFALVNKISKKFFESERRYNYTTPKTFLELIKLYKNVLGAKRKATQVRSDPHPARTCGMRLIRCFLGHTDLNAHP